MSLPINVTISEVINMNKGNRDMSFSMNTFNIEGLLQKPMQHMVFRDIVSRSVKFESQFLSSIKYETRLLVELDKRLK